MHRYAPGQFRGRTGSKVDGVTALAASVLSILALFVLFQWMHTTKSPTLVDERPFDPVEDDKLVHDATVLETDTLILQPATTRAVLVVFHRCGHSPLQWWHAMMGCYDCFGLPEHIAITRAALRRSMGVVAIKASSKRGCWDTHHPMKSKDTNHVLKEVKRVESLMGWEGKPRYALGAAEGGAMALIMARYLRLQGVCSFLMGVSPSQLSIRPMDEDTKETWRFPPTIFVHMARDKTTAAWIVEDVNALKQLGVSVKEIVVTELPLSETFFSERMPSVSKATSAALFKALKQADLLNQSSRLIKDPRPHAGVWKQVLKDDRLLNESLSHHDLLGIQQELNVAWAGHEVTSDPIAEVLNWFSKSGSTHTTRLTVNGAYMPKHTKQLDDARLP